MARGGDAHRGAKAGDRRRDVGEHCCAGCQRRAVDRVARADRSGQRQRGDDADRAAGTGGQGIIAEQCAAVGGEIAGGQRGGDGDAAGRIGAGISADSLRHAGAIAAHKARQREVRAGQRGGGGAVIDLAGGAGQAGGDGGVDHRRGDRQRARGDDDVIAGLAGIEPGHADRILPGIGAAAGIAGGAQNQRGIEAAGQCIARRSDLQRAVVDQAAGVHAQRRRGEEGGEQRSGAAIVLPPDGARPADGVDGGKAGEACRLLRLRGGQPGHVHGAGAVLAAGAGAAPIGCDDAAAAIGHQPGHCRAAGAAGA